MGREVSRETYKEIKIKKTMTNLLPAQYSHCIKVAAQVHIAQLDREDRYLARHRIDGKAHYNQGKLKTK